jgi:hypothetical protein
MSLEGLLSFLAIMVAIMAVVDPVQRKSLSFLTPWRWLVGAAALSTVLLLVRDGLRARGSLGGPLDDVLSSLSFLIPAGIGIICILRWHRAQLPSSPDRALTAVYELVRAALLENRFTEVERVLRANKARLRKLTDEHTILLFDPRLIAAFLASGSSFHLELLADLSYVDALPNRFSTVHAVVRALLVEELSPLRSVIIERTSAQERYHATAGDAALIDATFGNPAWYLQSSAYYALVVAAVQEVESGDRDEIYNGPLGLYGTTHGRSTRTRCPIFMAEKTVVFALGRAIAAKVEDNSYVFDLCDLYRTILAHLEYRETIWDQPFAESPTPFAYLLTEITNDFRKLATNALQSSKSENGTKSTNPGHIVKEIAQAWSFCVWSIADSRTRVSDTFRTERVRDYLDFVFQLSSTNHAQNPWRDLFADELKVRLLGHRDVLDFVTATLNHSDIGKEHARAGRDWLRSHLTAG